MGGEGWERGRWRARARGGGGWGGGVWQARGEGGDREEGRTLIVQSRGDDNDVEGWKVPLALSNSLQRCCLPNQCSSHTYLIRNDSRALSLRVKDGHAGAILWVRPVEVSLPDDLVPLHPHVPDPIISLNRPVAPVLDEKVGLGVVPRPVAHEDVVQSVPVGLPGSTS